MTQITFGSGDYGVDIGTYGGKPAVYITPNAERGPVGERIPLEKQGELTRDTLLDGETVLIFPTHERCQEVANALVGSSDRAAFEGRPAKAELNIEQILNDHFYTGEPGQHGAIKAAAKALRNLAIPAKAEAETPTSGEG